MRTVVFDFDGVIHSYMRGWMEPEIIPGRPVPGIRSAIRDLRAHGYKVVVASTRCVSEVGRRAVERWLNEHAIEVDGITAEKPPAICYIDDRAICFDGHPETLLGKVKSFKPWNR